ncbi:Nitrogen regulatory protein PII [Candidatus Magnetoovum chiemensis]|nr:Nitrogen regulatory protein PII [Candidatus Magnetoovum chiemensis]
MDNIVNAKIIVCYLPLGKAKKVMAELKNQKNIITANVNRARSAIRISALDRTHEIEQSVERDILSVVVNQEDADEIFDLIYEQANIDEPHGGFMFITGLDRATLFTLPDSIYEETDRREKKNND